MILNITGKPISEELTADFGVKEPKDQAFRKECVKLWKFETIPSYADLADRAEEFVSTLLDYRDKDVFSKVLLPESPAWFIGHLSDALLVEDITPCFIHDFGGKFGLVEEE